ncbi:MobA/MobL family protein [Chelativorans sp. SCAU2101]|uniref:MobA/MobL family protein n=1 Tax=Chelativorans petroleitrophicus TaxID=2975484 RepID=A0A9X3B8Z8_9HYPH|nr:MobA/MobL family protein [Chelativorans petroleitrophicus]
MTTSLPPDSAIFNVRVSVFQRSAGRSAVAAAAYRSASRLTDERIGERFDYRKKPCRDAFIIAPPGAPTWAYDREELWNRVERAERRRDAVVAREVLITIPRDIPEEDRRAFIEQAVAPYVAAGAIADIAYHCPRAADGEEQPHFHVMLSTRALDPSPESGFARTRNAALTAMFESGGRHGGGERGEALKAERERIAALMNDFLARAGSVRRADHRSNAARGLHDREPEPRIGEGRKRAVLRRRRHDRRTAAVSAMRQARIVANALTATEEEIMQTNPARQAKGGIRPRTKMDFKARLLRKRFPDLLSVEGWAGSLHFVDTSDPSFTRIATKDGGHVEVRNRIARVYGQRGQADALAAAIEAAGDVDAVERLEQLRTLQRRGSGIRQRRKPDGIPALPAAEVESLADRWRSRGYHRITEAPDGVWIEIGRCRLQDLGDELRVHGPVASDAAVRAMVEKAAAEWAGEVEVWGDQAFADQIWLEAQRQGITVYDQATGELYHPSEEVRARYDRDRSRLKAEGEEIEEIKRRKAIASLLLEAASGNAEALTRLRTNDRDLADFVTLHLDDEQRGRLVGKPEADVVAALADFRSYGRAARAAEDERRKAGPRVVGYVVSNEHGAVELETEDLSEAYEYKDVLDAEGRSAAIGTAYSDGSTSFEAAPRRPVPHPDAETHERRPT